MIYKEDENRWSYNNNLIPRMPKEFIHWSCILSIHQRRNPETPYPPAWNMICHSKLKELITWNENNHRSCKILITSRNDVSSKSHYNQHGKRSEGVGNYHMTAQGSNYTKESYRHLMQKEIQQKLSRKSAKCSTKITNYFQKLDQINKLK